MIKFDSDFAIFGTFAAEIADGMDPGKSVVSYVNKACIDLYDDLTGKTTYDILLAIAGSKDRAAVFMEKLRSTGDVSFEGTLNGEFIEYHSHIVECDDSKRLTRYVQSEIKNITETVALKNLLYGTTEALKRAAEAADEDTVKHISRITQYAGELASLAGCSGQTVSDISQFAQLHDIGKIRVAEIIRLPRTLTDEEYSKIKKHTIYGGEILEGILGLEIAHNIALEHHERWDGTGYPYGKKGDEISLEGRIVGIIDVFDALVSARPYKEPFSYEKSYEILEKGDGRVMPSHFDPELLELFLANYNSFVKIHKRFKD